MQSTVSASLIDGDPNRQVPNPHQAVHLVWHIYNRFLGRDPVSSLNIIKPHSGGSGADGGHMDIEAKLTELTIQGGGEILTLTMPSSSAATRP